MAARSITQGTGLHVEERLVADVNDAEGMRDVVNTLAQSQRLVARPFRQSLSELAGDVDAAARRVGHADRRTRELIDRLPVNPDGTLTVDQATAEALVTINGEVARDRLLAKLRPLFRDPGQARASDDDDGIERAVFHLGRRYERLELDERFGALVEDGKTRI